MTERSPAADPPRDATEAVPATRDRLVAFARTLRADGATVPADASTAAAEALSVVGLGDRRRVRAATKATLVAERADIALFDRRFPAFWNGLQREFSAGDETESERVLSTDRDAVPIDRAESEREREGEPTQLSASAREPADGEADERTGDDRDRSAYSPAGDGTRVDAVDPGLRDLDERDLRAFTTALATITERRWESGPGPRPDVRRALRRSVTTGGTIATVPHRRRAVAAPSYCLVVDVSRSVLDTIDRGFLVALLAGLHRESRSTRTFFFDTGVRDVTTVFEGSDGPVEALEAAELAWGGGTRIGRSIAALRRAHPHAVDADTTVIVLSDGFDVGDLGLLEGGMAWLRRRAAGVLWLNPLAGTDGYEPTCRGMSRALPYVDGLFPIASSEDLREIGRQIERRGLGGRIGYEYDGRSVDK